MTVSTAADRERKSATHTLPVRPDLTEEERLWQAGYVCVAGLDEVGRGALAGPVVAAAVVLPPRTTFPAAVWAINDSKQVSPAQRQQLFGLVQQVALATGIGLVSAPQIDRMGIAAATRQAMHVAVAEIQQQGHAVDYLLIDFLTLELPLPQAGLVKGDCRSLSIAAASIVAKVTRDRLMVNLAGPYPGYGFEQHKGYGTAAHRAAIARLGPCAEHRRSFSPVSQLPLPLVGTNA